MNNEIEQDIPPVKNSTTASRSIKIERFFIWLIILFILIGGIYACYFSYVELKQIKNELSFLPKIQQRQVNTTQKVQQFANQLNKLRKNLRATRQDVKQIQINNQSSHDDLFILQARDYLTLAGINLYLTDSVKPILMLFTQADRVLAKINNSQILPIRQAIAKEKAMIMALPEVDFVGIISQLQALENEVKTLPLKWPLINNQQESDGTKFKDTINLLKKLVIIRRTDPSVDQLWTQSQEIFIRERVKFYLEMSEWALLHKEAKMYEMSLQQAMEVVYRYFNDQVKETQAFLQQVTNLKQIQLFEQKPALGDALQLLNSFIDKVQQQGATGA